MTGSDWKHPHIIVLVAATALAFGGGYAFGTSRTAPRTATAPIVIDNELMTAPPPRARPDENTLIAENAEREEAVNRSRPEPPPAQPRPPAREREPEPDSRDLVEPGMEAENEGDKPERL